MEDQAKGEEINVTADAKLEEVDNFHAIDRKYIMPDVDKDMLPIISGEFYNDNHISFTMPILSYEFKHLGLRSYFRMSNRVFQYCPYLVNHSHDLTKDVTVQYKVKAKKNRI